MKLLFITLLPFYPDMAGGAQRTHLSLFNLLRQRGWQIEVISGLSHHSPYFMALKLARLQALVHFRRPPRYVLDTDLGFPCWRGVRSHHPLQSLVYKALRISGYSPNMTGVFRGCITAGTNVFTPAELNGARKWLGHRLNEFSPDVVLGHHGVSSLLSHAARQGYPSFYFAHGMGNMKARRVFPDEIYVIANSPFTASWAAQTSCNEVGVVLPIVDPNSYRVAVRQRHYITFINPIPAKGLDVAVEIARQLPQQRFLFVKGGWSDTWNRFLMKISIRRFCFLPNVDVWDYQKDMRRVYAVTNILMVPSRRESFGRVIFEAHINGIPVVAARVGGIPYTIGRGGILVDPEEGPQAYVTGLRRLCNDERYYAELSALALQNSKRLEFNPQNQVDGFISIVKSGIQK